VVGQQISLFLARGRIFKYAFLPHDSSSDGLLSDESLMTQDVASRRQVRDLDELVLVPGST